MVRRGKSKEGSENIDISIGDNARNVAAGKDIRQSINEEARRDIGEADLTAVRELFAELKRKVDAESPMDMKSSAIERITELEEAVMSEKPEFTTIDYVKKWFSRNLPQLAGTVVSVLVNPVLGKVVEAAGEVAAEEFKRIVGQR